MPDIDRTTGPVAYLNGSWIPFAEARLPVYDLGLVQGATLTERLRTFRHQPYLVAEHLQRLRTSLAAIGWQLPELMEPMEQVLTDLVELNTRWLPESVDLAVVLFVTAGQLLGDANGFIHQSRPTVCAYTAPLPVSSWAFWHRQGLRLVTPEIRQLPGNCISSAIKHRSRLHWTLADQQVRRQTPGAAALLLNQRDFVTETSSGNLFVRRADQLLTPHAEETLNGIAQAHMIELAARQGWSVQRADLTLQDVATADEAFLTSSTYCMVPVSDINGHKIGTAIPGRVTRMLMDVWCEEIGFDFVRQALDAG